GGHFHCLMSGTPFAPAYIRAEGKAGRMGARMMAIVAEGDRGRVYLPPTEAMEEVARQANPRWKPEGALVEDARAFTPTIYGLEKWSDLFTLRQLVALTTFADLVHKTRERVNRDALAAGQTNDGKQLAGNGTAVDAYADAVVTYLALSLSKVADYNCALVP